MVRTYTLRFHGREEPITVSARLDHDAKVVEIHEVNRQAYSGLSPHVRADLRAALKLPEDVDETMLVEGWLLLYRVHAARGKLVEKLKSLLTVDPEATRDVWDHVHFEIGDRRWESEVVPSHVWAVMLGKVLDAEQLAPALPLWQKGKVGWQVIRCLLDGLSASLG